jgi:hypothetical protein
MVNIHPSTYCGHHNTYSHTSSAPTRPAIFTVVLIRVSIYVLSFLLVYHTAREVIIKIGWLYNKLISISNLVSILTIK